MFHVLTVLFLIFPRLKYKFHVRTQLICNRSDTAQTRTLQRKRKLLQRALYYVKCVPYSIHIELVDCLAELNG